MGYKNPNVVKEVYLPISKDDTNLTPDEYKSKYGIDIRDFLEVDEDDHMHLKPLWVKLYIVFTETITSRDMPQIVMVNNIAENNNEATSEVTMICVANDFGYGIQAIFDIESAQITTIKFYEI